MIAVGGEPLRTKGFRLFDWQQEAVRRWIAGRNGIPHRGTVEIFTGGGKTLIALECAARASQEKPDLRLAIVVPTEALAYQWSSALLERTTLHPDQVGMLGARRTDSLADRRALVCVINTAAQRLPEMAVTAQPLMLIVDECHRAGAPEFSHVLDTEAPFRLGLSATPEREEFTEEGEPLEFDEQLVGQKLGPIVYRFTFQQARAASWLPELRIEHHGVQLRPDERVRYDRISRQIDDLLADLQLAGGDSARARQLARRTDSLGRQAARYVSATSKRKDILYRARERSRVAEAIVRRELLAGPARILTFHERVTEAEELYRRFHSRFGARVAIEHSNLPDTIRLKALDNFRSGQVQILVSVRSLIEGIDVPEADVGISVAASSSVRQRIQSLGRVLRRNFQADQLTKVARMHLLYVRDTVDELIYSKENWEELTGRQSNFYYLWPLDPDTQPSESQHPPRTPPATEEDEWTRIGRGAPLQPVEWFGEIPDREFSVDTSGTVRATSGRVITSWPEVSQMLEALRGEPGGRFHLTPEHRIAIAYHEGKPFVIGQLPEPIHYLGASAHAEECPDVSSLEPGNPYPGPIDAEYGTFRLAMKKGGVIERRRGRTREFARIGDARDERLSANGLRILGAWRQALDRGIDFNVNSCWHAWYLDAGTPRFLAQIEGGFEFPTEA